MCSSFWFSKHWNSPQTWAQAHCAYKWNNRLSQFIGYSSSFLLFNCRLPYWIIIPSSISIPLFVIVILYSFLSVYIFAVEWASRTTLDTIPPHTDNSNFFQSQTILVGQQTTKKVNEKPRNSYGILHNSCTKSSSVVKVHNFFSFLVFCFTYLKCWMQWVSNKCTTACKRV